jgi:hypothetical protein
MCADDSSGAQCAYRCQPTEVGDDALADKEPSRTTLVSTGQKNIEVQKSSHRTIKKEKEAKGKKKKTEAVGGMVDKIQDEIETMQEETEKKKEKKAGRKAKKKKAGEDDGKRTQGHKKQKVKEKEADGAEERFVSSFRVPLAFALPPAVQTQECPGSPQEVQITSQNSCAKHGVAMKASDGTALEDYFWDNVGIKEVTYEVYGETFSKHEDLMAYNFTKKPAGDSSPSVVEVLVKDVGNFKAFCHRSVYVRDDVAPIWQNPPPDSSGGTVGQREVHTLEFAAGENCSRTAAWLFNWYEEERTSWDATAVDNCQHVDGMPTTYREIYNVDDSTGATGPLLYSENPDNQPDTLVDEYIGEQQLLLVYSAVDGGGKQMDPADFVNITVRLEDSIGPSADDVICPANVHVALLHNESHATISWMKPTVIRDNCPPRNGAYPRAQEEARESISGVAFPTTIDRYDDANTHVVGHTGQFQPGVYEVDYSLRDSSGNIYQHECKISIEVEQYASPVHLECPKEITASITGKKNFVPVMWEEPDHKNGRAHQDTNPVNVSYYPAVLPGMAFPWGTTTITILAEGMGKVFTGEHNRAECSFVVSVTDERPPMLDGKQYQCRKLPTGATAPGAAPFRLCQAKKHLTIHEHSSYNDTGGYSIRSVDEMALQPCCASEGANGTLIEHYCHWESEMVSYCKPGVPPAIASQSALPTSKATTTSAPVTTVPTTAPITTSAPVTAVPTTAPITTSAPVTTVPTTAPTTTSAPLTTVAAAVPTTTLAPTVATTAPTTTTLAPVSTVAGAPAANTTAPAETLTTTEPFFLVESVRPFRERNDGGAAGFDFSSAFDAAKASHHACANRTAAAVRNLFLSPV